jgi:VWFA-related protein
MVRRVVLPLAMAFAAIGLAAQQPAEPPKTQAQQRPVFRAGTHFVRVDAYPSQDGVIVEGLEADDFEILEDGKPQKIESFDFVKFDTFTAQEERRDPNTQREGFDRAADPRYRVFVIVVDMVFGNRTDIFHVQKPLVHFLDRILGSRDLYGFLTSRNTAKDLVLGQKSGAIQSQVEDLFRSANIDVEEETNQLTTCANGASVLLGRWYADRTYTTLESLVQQLGSLRQERKNVVFVTNSLTRARPDKFALEALGGTLPRIGITNGRLGAGEHNSPVRSNDSFCAGETQRLASMDFDLRYRQLLESARRENVSFYTVTPGGLRAPATVPGIRAVQAANDDLRSLAEETDGIAIVDTNDLDGGMKRIAADLAAYYVLGYYTTNTTFDGRLRTIKVRYKANGNPIRARRQYRAPTPAEIAALAASAVAAPTAGAAPAGPSAREAALTILDRASRPFAAYVASAGRTLTVVTEMSASAIQTGRWKQGADVEAVAIGANGEPLASARGTIPAGSYSAALTLDVSAAWPARVEVRLRGDGEGPAQDWVKMPASSTTLIGDAVAYRSASRIAPRPVAAFEFARNERIRAEWPVLTALDRREVRLLDQKGKPLPVELPLSEDPAKRTLVVEMSLSGLPRGDYLVEVTVGAAGKTEQRLLAIRVR